MEGKKILVVDDDAAVVAVIQATLEDEGYVVETAAANEALELARQDPPDLILLDLVMPEMDGRQVRQRLLAEPGTAAVPIVMMSSELQLPIVARELRVQGCLSKPFDLDDLVAIVRQKTNAA